MNQLNCIALPARTGTILQMPLLQLRPVKTRIWNAEYDQSIVDGEGSVIIVGAVCVVQGRRGGGNWCGSGEETQD